MWQLFALLPFFVAAVLMVCYVCSNICQNESSNPESAQMRRRIVTHGNENLGYSSSAPYISPTRNTHTNMGKGSTIGASDYSNDTGVWTCQTGDRWGTGGCDDTQAWSSDTAGGGICKAGGGCDSGGGGSCDTGGGGKSDSGGGDSGGGGSCD